MYDERYVAYVDILGFSDIVKKIEHDTTPVRYDALLKSLTEIGTHDEASLNEGDDVQFQSFSDSIILSSAPTSSGFLHIISAISELYIRLLRNGLLMRGAVAKGKLHHDRFVMFGPAFLSAYDIETRIAKYPRIVFSRQAYDDFRKLDSGLLFPKVLLAEDGPPYLHTFAKFRMLNEGSPTIEFINSPEVMEALECQRAIQTLLNDSIHEPNHYEKLRWLAIYWNSKVAFGVNGPLQMIQLPRNV